MSIEIPINVNMEVEESQMAFNMSVDEEIEVTVIQGTDVSDTTAVEADVISGKKFHKSNGDLATGTLPVYYTKIGEADYTVSTSSTSAVLQTSLSVPSSVWTSAKMIFITIRDKAGKRAGYYYGSDGIFSNPNPSNGSTSAFGDGSRIAYSCDLSSKMHIYSGQYGLYPYSISSDGTIRMYAKYHSTYTLTIDGTYHVEVYALSWPDSSPLT